MDRAIKLLNWLALVVAAAGVVCFYLAYRPVSLSEGVLAARHFVAGAFASPVVPIAALTFVVAAVTARLLERTPPLERSTPGVHKLEDESRTADRPTPAKLSVPPKATSRRQRERLRPRLEAHLKGDPDVVSFIDDVLLAGVEAGASDIHFQPLEASTRVTFRVGGELAEVATAPRSQHAAVVRRLKILSRLVTYQSDRPQDGHILLDVPGGSVDLRVSILPTNHGEKVVLRLARAALLDLDRLGMPAALREPYEELLRSPQGIIVLTGPTGSGKTTTLYASLAFIHEHRGATANIASIEDPVEVDLPFLNQTERTADLTFDEGLRAVLRQDPNVLMIGEIRDRETAQIAVKAGLSGHLILTTLHADSSAGVINRLVDLGVEPFLVASSVLATVSQRLVRCLCQDCRHPAPLHRPVARRLTGQGIATDGLTFQTAAGCRACDETGFIGRQAIFEMMRVTPSLRQLITSKPPTDRIAELAVREGTTPLLRSAVAAAAAGTISLDEALRVAG